MQINRLFFIGSLSLLSLGVITYLTFEQLQMSPLHALRAEHKTVNDVKPIFNVRVDSYRDKAAMELEEVLGGAMLSEENLNSLNSQIIEIGIEVDKTGKVNVLNNEDWQKAMATKNNAEEIRVKERMAQAHRDFEQLRLSTP